MARTPTFPLYDRLLGGRLGSLLADAVAQGLSLQEIRDQLRDRHGLNISISTIRRWLDQLDLATRNQQHLRDGAA